MKKLNNKGMIASQLLALIFVPGTIPVLIGTLFYKALKGKKIIIFKKKLQNQ